jgi:hypothetical protein
VLLYFKTLRVCYFSPPLHHDESGGCMQTLLLMISALPTVPLPVTIGILKWAWPQAWGQSYKGFFLSIWNNGDFRGVIYDRKYVYSTGHSIEACTLHWSINMVATAAYNAYWATPYFTFFDMERFSSCVRSSIILFMVTAFSFSRWSSSGLVRGSLLRRFRRELKIKTRNDDGYSVCSTKEY